MLLVSGLGGRVVLDRDEMAVGPPVTGRVIVTERSRSVPELLRVEVMRRGAAGPSSRGDMKTEPRLPLGVRKHRYSLPTEGRCRLDRGSDYAVRAELAWDHEAQRKVFGSWLRYLTLLPPSRR